MKEKILIRGTNWIGDAVMTFPAISYLQRANPGARLDVVARPWVSPVYRCHPGINQVIDYPCGPGITRRISGMIQASLVLRRRRYDRGVLLPNSLESALLFRLAGIGHVLGYSTDFRSMLLERPVPVPSDKEKRHHVFYYLDLVRSLRPSNVEMKGSACKRKLDFHIPEDEKQRARAFLTGISQQEHQKDRLFFTGFNPGAAFGPAKCWPASRFKDLAGLLLRAFPGMHILVFGTKKEKEIADKIRTADPKRVTSLCGQTSLMEAMSLINELDLLVSNDSGLMHVAAACSTPLIALFGSTNPVATGPWSEDARIISLGLECAPCMSRTCPRDFECMLGIRAEDVFTAARDMLENRLKGAT